MKKKYILALDEGTGSARAAIFAADKTMVGMSQIEFKQYFPKPGYVEQDPMEIMQAQLQAAQNLLSDLNIKPDEIASIGITNQRETTVLWDKRTGKPVYNAIVWQDNRTADYCNMLKSDGLAKYIKTTTGLVIDSYFSGTKLHWLFKNVPGAKERALKGELLFGTIDTWLIWNLSGGKLHITDYSNASRTMLFDINSLTWDETLLKLFGIPYQVLPNVVQSSELYGYTAPNYFEGVPIPIAGIAGDQQAALFGQTCFKPGMAKNTYGTGCFMLMNTGSFPPISENGLLTTIAWGINGKVEYALEGSVFYAGAAIRWLRDELKIIKTAAESEYIANSIPNSGGVYMVPAFSGLGAPYWDMDARGAIVGLSPGISYKHIVRATLESIAYSTRDILTAMQKDADIKLLQLKVDGGAAANNFLMQFQSDILGTRVSRPNNLETTAMGAAYLAGLAVGFYTMDDLVSDTAVSANFEPSMLGEDADKLYVGWLNAIEKVRL